MVKEGESGEVPVARVLGDIDCSTVPFTLLKTDPLQWGGTCQGRGFAFSPVSVLRAGGRNPPSPGLEGDLNPLNGGL